MKYAIVVIAAFVWNAHIKRALHSIDPNPRLNFWRVLYGDCLDMAVIDWCKLFGSDSDVHQPVHWKNVIPEQVHDSFREGLLEVVGVSEAGWQDYWDCMKGYRDNLAAHFNEEYLRPENDRCYPDLGIALEAAYFYYDRLLVLMKERGIAHMYPEDIRDYSGRFASQAGEVARRVLTATADMEEKVQ